MTHYLRIDDFEMNKHRTNLNLGVCTIPLRKIYEHSNFLDSWDEVVGEIDKLVSDSWTTGYYIHTSVLKHSFGCNMAIFANEQDAALVKLLYA